MARAFLSLLAAAAVSPAWAALPEPELGSALVERLLRPETRADAFYELTLRTEGSPRWRGLPRTAFDAAMRGIRLTRCPGRDGAAPLYLLTWREDFSLWYAAAHPEETALANGSRPGDFYPPDPGVEARRARWQAAPGKAHLTADPLDAPLPAPELEGRTLLFLDANGTVRWPYGGDNSGAKEDHLADLNGDGVFERLSHINYGVEEGTRVEVALVRTVEAEPRLLLAVVLNWHPGDRHAANEWKATVLEPPREGGLPRIALGPKGGKPEVEYRWEAGAYTGPGGKPGEHFRRLPATREKEVWPDLHKLQKAGGLGYPLQTTSPATPSPQSAPARPHPSDWKSWPPYRHQSLAALDDETLFRWQYGGEPETGALHSREVVFPPGLFALPPKEAALAFADANRTRAHRALYDLGFASDAAPPPREGVLRLNTAGWGWSGGPEMIRFLETGAEWWRLPQGGPLPPARYAEAQAVGWLAETLGWLDCLRTLPRGPEPLPTETGPAFFIACGTNATLLWQTDAARVLDFRFGHVPALGRHWRGPYTRIEAGALAYHLWRRQVALWRETGRVREVPLEEAVEAWLPPPGPEVGPEGLWARTRLSTLASPTPTPTPTPPPAPRAGPAPAAPEPGWEASVAAYRQPREPHVYHGDQIDALLKAGAGRPDEVWAVLRGAFEGAPGHFSREIAAAYNAGLREAASADLARLATFSPDEPDGPRLQSSGGPSGGLPVEGRFHLARQILAVWEEPHPLTRAKLLLLLGLAALDAQAPQSALSTDRLEADLQAAAALLDAGERARLAAFARWCATGAVGRVDDYPGNPGQIAWLTGLLGGWGG